MPYAKIYVAFTRIIAPWVCVTLSGDGVATVQLETHKPTQRQLETTSV